MDNKVIILKADEVGRLLENKENEIMNIVSDTYSLHTKGMSSLPHSIFLRFPEDNLNRIIGLPSYLGGEKSVAGMKWISSFPKNIENGIERASAVTILNNIENGRCEAIMEGAAISAKRTAASAALAAKILHGNIKETSLGLVGCGRINYEIMCFIVSAFPNIKKIFLYDLLNERARNFSKYFEKDKFNVEIVNYIDDIFTNTHLISFATTAGVPYVSKLKDYNKDMTILNISLRDLSAEVIEKCDNVVDDIDHVLREKTSVHLTETKLGNRDFIRCSIGDIILENNVPRRGDRPVIYSPFGLGVLDMALANYVKEKAEEEGIGTIIENFQ